MTNERNRQADTVHTALVELATRLAGQGIPADVIVAVMNGFATGHAVNLIPGPQLSQTLRDMADRVDEITMPCAGSA